MQCSSYGCVDCVGKAYTPSRAWTLDQAQCLHIQVEILLDKPLRRGGMVLVLGDKKV